jgi:hypothetical protein
MPQATIIPNGAKSVYAYPVNFRVSIPAGGNNSGSFLVQNDSQFLWIGGWLQAFITSASGNTETRATVEIPNLSVLIQSTDSAAQLMNTPVPVGSLFGMCDQPMYFDAARLFDVNTQVTLTVNNLDPAQAYILFFAFLGVKIYNL